MNARIFIMKVRASTFYLMKKLFFSEGKLMISQSSDFRSQYYYAHAGPESGSLLLSSSEGRGEAQVA